MIHTNTTCLSILIRYYTQSMFTLDIYRVDDLQGNSSHRELNLYTRAALKYKLEVLVLSHLHLIQLYTKILNCAFHPFAWQKIKDAYALLVQRIPPA